ncbi:MAG: prepilin-type N-terminal cleavage/methylation domain-containing protein [Desulfobacteraceae bacterium]|nr:prepilin-type N-terminal cleavage/methylation domain-containing protein [Desulfobacteraceae bacterium]
MKYNSQVSSFKFQVSTSKGFTLIELLISLTILAVIVVIIFGALRISVRAWEKGEKDVETHQRCRIVLNLIKRQLASVCQRKVTNNSEQSFDFKGDNKSLEFLSYVALSPNNNLGIVFVKYLVESEQEDREQLIFFENNVVLSDKDTSTDDLNEDDFHMLIPEVQSIEFEYLKGQTQEKDFEWQQSWDPENDKGYPLAIKVILKTDEESEPINVIARIEGNEN